MKISKKHFSCKNCGCVFIVKFRQGEFCAGLVEKVIRNNDKFRICFIREKKQEYVFDFSTTEINSLAEIIDYLRINGEIERRFGKARKFLEGKIKCQDQN